jgi:4-hydroxybenzoate polyprenyltransferase
MSTVEPEPYSPLDPLRAYLELVRAPNLFTSMADVVMGLLFSHPFLTSDRGFLLAVLMLASTCFYAGGVALNDVFDAEIDSRERPERPIPSGRVPMDAARRLGWGLLAAGVVLAGAAALLASSLGTAAVGLLLATSVVLYDRFLKSTPLGPINMGLCRMLNVLLGMSVGLSPWGAGHWLAAGAIGVYVAGVTWLARGETGTASRLQLTFATLVILSGVAMLFVLPRWTENRVALLDLEPYRWYLLVGILGTYTGLRCFQTVAEPEADVIQSAVKHCILSLVILDAAICYVVWDLQGAIAVLALLIPTVVLGRWVYST